MKIIEVKVFQLKQLKRRNLKKFRLERNSVNSINGYEITQLQSWVSPQKPSPPLPLPLPRVNRQSTMKFDLIL